MYIQNTRTRRLVRYLINIGYIRASRGHIVGPKTIYYSRTYKSGGRVHGAQGPALVACLAHGALITQTIKGAGIAINSTAEEATDAEGASDAHALTAHTIKVS